MTADEAAEITLRKADPKVVEKEIKDFLPAIYEAIKFAAEKGQSSMRDPRPDFTDMSPYVSEAIDAQLKKDGFNLYGSEINWQGAIGDLRREKEAALAKPKKRKR